MADVGLLVVGAGRGGTSLLAALLDAHPSLEVELEAHTFVLLNQGVPSLERVRRYREACEQQAEGSTARIWGNKVTTEQIFALCPDEGTESLEQFFGEFEGVPVVLIMRDGRRCVESKVRHMGMAYEDAAERWRFLVEAFRFLRERGAFTITFEQLVAEPEPTLTAVCDFLQLPFSERMLEGTDSEKLAPVYRRDRVEPERAAVPALPPEIYDSIAGDLQYCGYR